MNKPVNVAIGVLAEWQGNIWHVLIAKRRPGGVLGGFWEFPGGKIEAGEAPKDCLVREFMEELGIVVKVGEPLQAIEHTYPHGDVKIQPFYCTRLRHEPQDRQVVEHRWVPAAELCRFRFPPANQSLLESIRARFEHGKTIE